MIVEQRIILTDEDKYLLSKPLPESPCERKCSPSYMVTCCGCPEGDQYRSEIQAYKNANIYEYAVMIDDIRRYKSEIKKLKSAIEIIYNTLPVEIKKCVGDVND